MSAVWALTLRVDRELDDGPQGHVGIATRDHPGLDGLQRHKELGGERRRTLLDAALGSPEDRGLGVERAAVAEDVVSQLVCERESLTHRGMALIQKHEWLPPLDCVGARDGGGQRDHAHGNAGYIFDDVEEIGHRSGEP